MAKLYLYPHGASNGADALAEHLKIKKIKRERSVFKGAKSKIVINWGNAKIDNPEILKCQVINPPEAVAKCTNKLRFFEEISGKKGVNVPDWTTDSAVAFKWVADGAVVVARTVLNGSSGVGIVIMDKDNPKSLVKAGLYTKYVPKRDEYRVHVIKGKVSDVQRKALRNGWIEEHGQPNYKIRNLDNGFVYTREGFTAPNCVPAQALAAIEAIGLDFGAVDIIFNEKQNKAYVLEINTAPGLEGTTVENYAKAFS